MPNPREGDKWGEDEVLAKAWDKFSQEGSLVGPADLSLLALPNLRTILAEVKSSVPLSVVSQGCHWNKSKFLLWPDLLGESGPHLPVPPPLSSFSLLRLFEDAKFFLASRLSTCNALSPDVGCWPLLI